MILINLLPEEFIEKKIIIPIPLREIALGLLAFFVLVWFFVMMRQGGIKKDLSALETEKKAVSGDVLKADQLIQEMNMEVMPKKNFMDGFEMPDAQWDQIMNLISDAVPSGIWLSSLKLSYQPDLTIRVEGLARPPMNVSSMSMIGDFITQMKKQLEELMTQFYGQQPAPVSTVPATAAPAPQPAPAPEKAHSYFQSETFTQQKDVDSQKLTEFIVDFKKKA